jgi:hypothetical protein
MYGHGNTFADYPDDDYAYGPMVDNEMNGDDEPINQTSGWPSVRSDRGFATSERGTSMAMPSTRRDRMGDENVMHACQRDHPAAAARDEFTDMCERFARKDATKTAIPILSGFVDKNGNRRKYDAPAMPRDAVSWPRLRPVLDNWKRSSGQAVDEKAQMLLLDLGPEDDDFDEDAVQIVLREAEEILRPMAITRDDADQPRRWTPCMERNLRNRGIKLADSYVIRAGSEKFLVRAFQLVFRFFVNVILATGDRPIDDAESDLLNRPFVGYYFVAMSTEQAIIERCV